MGTNNGGGRKSKPIRNSDGTFRNLNKPYLLKNKTLVSRWVEAETVRLKRVGVSFQDIAAHIMQVVRNEVAPATPLPPGIEFPPGYHIGQSGVSMALRRLIHGAAQLEAADIRYLQTERTEDLYKSMQRGVSEGSAPHVTAAVKVLNHQAAINGLLVPNFTVATAGFAIHIHLDPGDKPPETEAVAVPFEQTGLHLAPAREVEEEDD